MMLIVFVIILIASALSVVTACLAVIEKDLVNSSIYLGLFGVFYSLIYYVFLAPDVLLAYIPISTTIIPALLIITLRKTRSRYEESIDENKEQ